MDRGTWRVTGHGDTTERLSTAQHDGACRDVNFSLCTLTVISPMTWVPSCSCDLREELTSSLGQAPLSYAQVNKQMTAHLRSLLLIKCLAAKGYKRRH